MIITGGGAPCRAKWEMYILKTGEKEKNGCNETKIDERPLSLKRRRQLCKIFNIFLSLKMANHTNSSSLPEGDGKIAENGVKIICLGDSAVGKSK